MTALEQAVRDAVEKGGYEPRDMDGDPMALDDIDFSMEGLVLPSDAAFWKSLGKARGWNDEMWVEYRYPIKTGKGNFRQEHQLEWQYHWHRFIDHLAVGGTIEDFFKSLD